MHPLVEPVLRACWHSAGGAVGAACGTARTLARALAADEREVHAALAVIITVGYVAVDRHGVVSMTETGARALRQWGPR